jgi:AcrR family transcriptional regulator
MDELLDLIRSVPRPPPILDPGRRVGLTARQREILDELSEIFDEGFVDLTMAGLAARLRCSLRTLYELAPSRDELVLVVVEQNVMRVGRAAIDALRTEMTPMAALRAYLSAATVAVATFTPAFARDLATVPAAQELSDAHSGYLVGVARCLLDAAVQRGEIPDVDTGAVARVVAGIGRDFARTEVIDTLRTSPKEAADFVVDLILDALVGRRPVRR